MGPDFPNPFDPSLVAKASKKWKDRMDSPHLQTLLGYKPPVKAGGTPSYGLLPLFLWADFVKYGTGFMMNPILFRVRFLLHI
jgi:hypothetical protein